MEENLSINELFRNIQSGLKIYSSQELIGQINETVKNLLDKKEQKRKYINYALEIVSEEYSIPVRVIINSKLRGKHQECRVMVYCLLHHELGLPSRYIAERVFDKWHKSVNDGLKYFRTLNVAIKEHKNFSDTYIKLKEKLIEKIKL